MDQTARAVLIRLYLDFCNNWLTIKAFAEANGLEFGEARQLLTLARTVAQHPHPEN